MASKAAVHRPGRKQWLFLLLSIAALYVLLPQLGIFHNSVQAIKQTQWRDLCIAAGFSGLTYVTAASTYCLLARKKLHFLRTILVQLASMFANRLLPAGVGGIGTNFVYLRKSRHTTSQAAGVVAANNLLGIIGHLLLVGLLFAFYHAMIPKLHVPHVDLSGRELSKTILIVLLVAAIVVFIRYRQRLLKGVHDVLGQLISYDQRPYRLFFALLTSMTLTVCNVISLYFCAHSLHIQLSFIAALLVFTIGIVLGTLTPTPGGLGGVEAGLVAGLVALHVPSADALAATLIYRLVSYWFMLLVGAGAFIVSERMGYL